MKKSTLPKFIIRDFQTSFWEKLIKFTPLHLHSMLTNNVKQKAVDLPAKIEKWRLVHDFQPDKPYPFKIGLYKDNKGNLVVAKVWQGKFKNIHYGNLINETVATHTLSTIRSRLEKDLTKEIRMVKTPQFIKVIKKGNRLIFMEEFVKGIRFVDLKDSEKIKVYKTVKKYFKFLGDNLSPKDKKLLRAATAKEIIKRYPIILAAALIRRTYLVKELLQGLTIFVKGIPVMMASENYSIVHGDINFDNILISKDKISVIDVEQLMYTFSDFEDVTTLSTARNSDNFVNWIVDANNKKFTKDKANAHLFSMLLIYCETYNLTGNSGTDSYNNHVRRLKMALKIYKDTNKQ